MQLNDKQRGDLLQVLNMPGYQVLLDLGNDECEKLVTELLSVESDREKILVRHTGARFARKFFDDLCVRSDREAKANLRPEITAALPVDFVREVDSPSDLPPDFIPEEWSGKKGPIITG